MLGHVGDEAVLVVRTIDGVRAVGATCTHYGAPLADGLVVGDTVRCPWHHACFSLRTGEAVGAPALNAVPVWDVELRDGMIRLGERRQRPPLYAHGREAKGPEPMVILGAGAAGNAAAEGLRREGYGGRIVVVDPDVDAPYDRPNLSKDFLSGAAPEEWIPLRPSGFYEEHRIDRVLERAASVDLERRLVVLETGETLGYGALLIATGAGPIRPDVPGTDLPFVHTLRSLSDCRRIIEGAGAARRAVVVGAGFIGMEVAASLRARGLEVTVVAPDEIPFARTFGDRLGSLLRDTHEEHGVRFRLGHTINAIASDHVVLDDGTTIPAELVILGVGVRPRTAIAEAAGLRVDNGIVVDEMLRTSDPWVFAAGDVARWPDARSGNSVRVEHWVVAQRQGQTVARSMLGIGRAHRDVPFFWTSQWGVSVSYVGHAPDWDRVDVDGDPAGLDAVFRFSKAGVDQAVATIGRDRTSLEAEVEMGSDAAGSLAGVGR